MAALRILALSGSLRAASTNTALLRAVKAAALPEITVLLYEGLGRLPIFDPDREATAGAEVDALRTAVAEAHGLIVACPEYAHGIPGGLKNALDWLVSGAEIPGKPVALFHASSRSLHGRAALSEVLRTMSAPVLSEFTLPLLGRTPADVDAVLAQAATLASLRAALERFTDLIGPPWTAPRCPHMQAADRRSATQGDET